MLEIDEQLVNLHIIGSILNGYLESLDTFNLH